MFDPKVFTLGSIDLAPHKIGNWVIKCADLQLRSILNHKTGQISGKLVLKIEKSGEFAT